MNSTLSLGLLPKVQAPIRGDLPGSGSTSQTPVQSVGKVQHDPALQTVLPLQSGHANPMACPDCKSFSFHPKKGLVENTFSTSIVSAHYTEGEVIEGQKLLKTSEIIVTTPWGVRIQRILFFCTYYPKT